MIKQLLKIYEQHGILIRSFPSELQTLPHPVTDHRDFQPGYCFIAIKGASFDGHIFIKQVLAKGAAFCIGETDQAQIVVKDSRKAAALYAKLFFGDPSARMTLFGVTGTNGKTTTSLMLYQMLLQQGFKAAWIGTMGYKILDMDYPTRHTTPDIMQLNQIFSDMLEQGISHVVMEVSSHALALDRVYAVEYDYCLFTNLSRDHLDFHRDMEEYFETKYLLFERAFRSSAGCIVNGDDPHGQLIAQRINSLQGNCLVVGRNPGSDLRIETPETKLDGTDFRLSLNDNDSCNIHSPLVGEFNIDNLALACGALLISGNCLCDLPALCTNLSHVPGRIEAIPNRHSLGVYIDYAHSPAALDNLLKSVEKLPHSRIITVFGAGGDRDQGKRPLMLKAALSHSDAVIITDDNPRTENPEKIIYDIVKDSEWNLPWWVIRNRAKAISAAIRFAMPDDIVLICGKGHETYQEIAGIRYDFDDRLVAEAALANLPIDKAEDELILGIDPFLIKLLLGIDPECVTSSLGKELVSSHQDPDYYRFLSTDSRSIKPGSVFFALKGENFDGNRFVTEVLNGDETIAVSSDASFQHPRHYFCENVEMAMAELLRKYLQMFSIYKIAITGSTGKTSSKEIIAQVLAHKADILKTKKNENNIIGLCKTILRVEPRHKYGVFEIGTNHFGEISRLASTITPDAGIILNIGPSHLEFFGDENGVFLEKSELFNRPLNIRIYPADDQRFSIYKEDGIGIGFDVDADFRISELECRDATMSFKLNEDLWEIPYKASHFAINSAFAIVLATHLEYQKDDIREALSHPVELDMRMQIEDKSQYTIIVDCYNANPVSMQSAIEFWHKHLPGRPHVAFLGDMLELGESSELYHRMIGAIIREIGENKIFSIGNHASNYQNTPENHYADVEMLLRDFPKLPPDAVILVKASHSVHLEKILPHLRGEV